MENASEYNWNLYHLYNTTELLVLYVPHVSMVYRSAWYFLASRLKEIIEMGIECFDNLCISAYSIYLHPHKKWIQQWAQDNVVAVCPLKV